MNLNFEIASYPAERISKSDFICVAPLQEHLREARTIYNVYDYRKLFLSIFSNVFLEYK